VFAGLRLMSEKNIGALLIVDGSAPVGIMTERDYARKIILDGRSSHETKISSIMTTRLVSAKTTDSVEQAMGLMTRERIRHLPVMDGARVAGLVSIGDLVKAMIDQQQFTIDQLERYITT
jgi:CBS domain-containing protein